MNNNNNKEEEGVEMKEHRAWIFNEDWRTLQQNELIKRSETKSLPSLFGIATYNVWFSPEDNILRFKALMERLKHIKAENPLHFICFQEVTPFFMNLLKKEEWIQKEYYCSDMEGKTITPNGVFLLIHHSLPLLRFTEHILPSNLKGRKLMIAEIGDPQLYVNNNSKNEGKEKNIWKIGSIHLDSKVENSEMRKVQLDKIIEIMNNNNNNNNNNFSYQLIAGDYNIDGFGKEQEEIDQRTPHLIDVWVKLRALDSNAYTKVKKPQRYDRILVSSDSFSPLSVERIGYHPVYFEGSNAGKELQYNVSKDDAGHPSDAIHPSDHCGLFATIRVNN